MCVVLPQRIIEPVLDAADALLKKNPDAMRQRKRLVEPRRAPLRYDQALDGIDALFNETITERASGDEPACAHLQSQTCDQHSRRTENHGTADDGLKGPVFDCRRIRLC